MSEPSSPGVPGTEGAGRPIINIPGWPCETCWTTIRLLGVKAGAPWPGFTLGEVLGLPAIITPRRRLDADQRRRSVRLTPRLAEIAERAAPDTAPDLFVLCADCRCRISEWEDWWRFPVFFIGPSLAGRLVPFVKLRRGPLDPAAGDEALRLMIPFFEIVTDALDEDRERPKRPGPPSRP